MEPNDQIIAHLPSIHSLPTPFYAQLLVFFLNADLIISLLSSNTFWRIFFSQTGIQCHPWSCPHYPECIYTSISHYTAAAAAKSLQSCLTLCDPIDSSPPGSPVPGILQARTLEWVAISFSNAWKWKVKVKSLSCAQLFMTPWTAAYQAPPSIGFSRQEYWSGVPLPSPSHDTSFSKSYSVGTLHHL